MRIVIRAAVVLLIAGAPAAAQASWDFFESFDNTNFFKPDGGPMTTPSNGWNGSWTEYPGSLSPAIDWTGGYGGSVGMTTDANAPSGSYGAWINEHPDRTPYGPELWSPDVGTDGDHSQISVHGNIYVDTTGSEYRQAYLEWRTEPGVAEERYVRVGYVANDPAEGGADYYFWAWKDDDDQGIWRTLPGEIPGVPVIEDLSDVQSWYNFGFHYRSFQASDQVAIMVFEGTSNDVQDPANWRFTMGWPTGVDLASPAELDTYAFYATGSGIAFDNFGVNVGVPEPTALGLLLLGGLALFRRRS
ncbi:MAG: PEP-CTERM sorting domain-containing protein [Phycisphaerae bacterium]|nr:PEP-CTERM sorting domain-containing protein [Phycisphaerae bacterium]